MVLLIFGITLTLNVYDVSAASTTTSNIKNQSSTQYQTITTTQSTNLKNTVKANSGTSNSKTIRVLIYNGNGAISDCVTGIETALNSANTKNLVPGYYFTYSTSKSITTSILFNYDILAMPGGTSGKTYINSVSGSVIRNFVSTGHGYLGICAGAYSGSQYVDGLYTAWGVAPDVRCKKVSHEGTLPVTMTSSGNQLLSTSGTIIMAHYNGPAMYSSGGSIVTFATYADSSTGYKNYDAIVGDTYGSGRTVLSGPHPELTPQNPFLLAKLIIWAANVVKSTPTNTISMNQVNNAAKTVKAYVDKNKKLPSYVTISGKQISMPKFLYFLTTDLLNVNSGSTASIALKTVNAPTAPKGTFNHGNILKTVYIKIANNIKTYINNYGRPPNYISTSLGNIRYESLLYMYSKLMAFYNTNNRLPNYVSM